MLSRIPWYNSIPKLLDRESEENPRKRLLRERICELYKVILLYQIRIVCSQRNEMSHASLATVDQGQTLTDADLSVTDILNAEKTLEDFLGEGIQGQMMGQFADPRDSQRDATTVSGGQRGGDQAVNGETRVKILLDNLSAVDRQQHHRGLGSEKGKTLMPLYDRLYQWISSLPEYKAFEADENRILWVTGTLGTGKLICTSAIMWELSRNAIKGFHPTLLSFSRDGNGQQKPENATSAIKSLFHAILKDQSCLVDLVADELESTDRKHLSYANDFYALSLILNRMVQDKRFKPTLILIDGVDEIQGDGTDFSRFLKLMRTTMSISHNIKWVVSADTLPKSDAIDVGLRISLDNGYPGSLAVFNDYYIPSKVEELTQYGNYHKDLRHQITKLLQDSSSGNFFWADVTCEVIKRAEPWHARHILEELLNYRNSSISKASPYSFMMDKISKLPFGDNDHCLDFFRAMAEIDQPIKLTELRALVNLPSEVDIERLINKQCFAFLEVCSGSVCFTHRSARDYYIGYVKEKSIQRHQWIVQNCLLFLSNLFRPPTSDDSYEEQTRDLTKSIYYPTVYWIRHLRHVADRKTRDCVVDFMT